MPIDTGCERNSTTNGTVYILHNLLALSQWRDHASPLATFTLGPAFKLFSRATMTRVLDSFTATLSSKMHS